MSISKIADPNAKAVTVRHLANCYRITLTGSWTRIEIRCVVVDTSWIFSTRQSWFICFYVSSESVLIGNVIYFPVDATLVTVSIASMNFLRVVTLLLPPLLITVIILNLKNST